MAKAIKESLKKKQPRVRKPVVVDTPSVLEDEEEVIVEEASPVLKERKIVQPEPVVEEESNPVPDLTPRVFKRSGKPALPKATVVLVEAAKLRRQGRVFVKERPFEVEGEEAIVFFENDSRFHVSRT